MTLISLLLPKQSLVSVFRVQKITVVSAARKKSSQKPLEGEQLFIENYRAIYKLKCYTMVYETV